MGRLKSLPRASIAPLGFAILGVAWFAFRSVTATNHDAAPPIRVSLVADTAPSGNVPAWPGYLGFADEPRKPDAGTRIDFKSAEALAQTPSLDGKPADSKIHLVEAQKANDSSAGVNAAPAGTGGVVLASNPVPTNNAVSSGNTISNNQGPLMCGPPSSVSAWPDDVVSTGGAVVPVIKIPALESSAAKVSKPDDQVPIAPASPPEIYGAKEPPQTAFTAPVSPVMPAPMVERLGPVALPAQTASPVQRVQQPMQTVQPMMTRSSALEQMAKQADAKVRHGFEMAGHGGYFAARAEMIAAMRLVAEALDNEQRTSAHSASLAAALTAFREAQDFVPSGNKVEGDLDMRGIIGSHSTPVMKDANAADLRPMLALQRYHTFAQMQFAQSIEHEIAGSMALYALGKVYAGLASEGNADVPVAEPKAIVCYHASLLACSQNYMAANDLGALLARDGDYAGARQMLEHSVMVRHCSSNLSNLARVYDQLGETRLAVMAREKAKYADQLETAQLKDLQGSSVAQVRWVDPDTMAQAANGTAQPGPVTHNVPTPDQSKPLLGMRTSPDQQNIQR